MTGVRPLQIDELTRALEPESSDPEYLAWKKAKIEAAIKEADAFPEDTLTEAEVWQKHGLDH